MTPWFKDGLRFKCTGCGECCTGSAGYVWVSSEEAETMAKHLNISVEEFSQKYLRRVGDRFSLIEHRRNGKYDCVFLNGKRCTIYEARPKQCRTYPWWPENVSSMEEWKAEGMRCEGINHPDAPLITLQDIQKHLPQE